jgi:hypothetical protein
VASPFSIEDAQLKSFFRIAEQDFARKVLGVGEDGTSTTISIGGYSFQQLLGDWPLLAVGNKIVATYPSGAIEEFSFQNTGGEVLKLRVTYSNPSKNTFVSVERIV